MPLYLDDAVPPPMPRAFLDVLLDGYTSFGEEAVNPAMVIGLLRERLLPLLPDVHKSLFDLRGQTSWDSLWILYANLATASGGTDKQLGASAAVVSISCGTPLDHRARLSFLLTWNWRHSRGWLTCSVCPRHIHTWAHKKSLRRSTHSVGTAGCRSARAACARTIPPTPRLGTGKVLHLRRGHPQTGTAVATRF